MKPSNILLVRILLVHHMKIHSLVTEERLCYGKFHCYLSLEKLPSCVLLTLVSIPLDVFCTIISTTTPITVIICWWETLLENRKLTKSFNEMYKTLVLLPSPLLSGFTGLLGCDFFEINNKAKTKETQKHFNFFLWLDWRICCWI